MFVSSVLRHTRGAAFCVARRCTRIVRLPNADGCVRLRVRTPISGMGIIRHTGPFAGIGCECCAPSSRKEVVQKQLSSEARLTFLLAMKRLQQQSLSHPLPHEVLRRIVELAVSFEVRTVGLPVVPPNRRPMYAADLANGFEGLLLCDEGAPP